MKEHPPPLRRTGSVRARPQGGDFRSHWIEAHGEEILALIEETPDITLAEIAAHLHKRHGLNVAQSTVWRLLDRHVHNDTVPKLLRCCLL